MKILHAIPSLEIGGAEKIVSHLSNDLAERGHDISILLFKPITNNSFHVKNGVAIKVIKSKLPFKCNVISIIKVLLYLRKENFDVVHTHLTINNTLVRFLAVLLKTPVVIGHEHGGFLTRNRIARLFQQKLEKFISYNIYISEHDLKHYTLYDKSRNAQKNIVVHNPLLVKPRSLTKQCRHGIRVIGMVGRIIELKGHMWALQEMCSFLRKHNCKVIIVGDGEERIKHDLLHFSRENNIELEITGYTQDIEQYLSCVDVLVHPSFSEGFGLAIIEAMAFGIPVVASNVGGIPNIIKHEYNGLLFDHKVKGELPEKLQQLNDDLSLKRIISERGYQSVVNKFSFSNYVTEMERLYSDSLTRKRTKSNGS